MVGRDTLATDLNVLIGWQPQVCEDGGAADFVMLGNLDPAVQLDVLNQTSKPSLVVLDTMNFWMDVALENLKKVIAKVDVLTVNDEEATAIDGRALFTESCPSHSQNGPKNRGY